ncbi:hypothetical protein [Streptomyces sp. NPDC001889]
MPQTSRPTAATETGSAAVRALHQALTVRQLNPIDLTPPNGQQHTLVFATSTGYTIAGVPVDTHRAFTEQDATALEAALRDHRVTAGVTPTEGLSSGPKITLPTAQDVQALTDLVWEEMPEPHRAAHRLRTVLTELGEIHRCPMDSVTPRVNGLRVRVGNVTVPQAFLLLRLMGGTRPDYFRQDRWQHIHDLAGMLRTHLRSVPPGITVTGDPVCGNCRDSRKPRIKIEDAPPDRIRALADRLLKGSRRTKAKAPDRTRRRAK